MPSVIVHLIKDNVGDLCPGGREIAVDVSSIIGNTEKISLADYPQACGEEPIPWIKCLKIKDPYKGDLWIRESELAFGALVSAAVSDGKLVTYTYEVGVDIPEGLLLVLTVLHNATVHSIVLGNTSFQNIPFNPTFTATQGMLDFTGIGGLNQSVPPTYLTLTLTLG